MVTTTHEREVLSRTPGAPTEQVGLTSTAQDLILVVDDDPPTLRLERVVLEEEGYVVQTAESGEAALQALQTSCPSLILLDIGLPQMDGFDTCTRIREVSPVPIIMVTGRDALEDKVRGMEAGADDFVTKPFLTLELVTRVMVQIRRSRMAAPPQPQQPLPDHQPPTAHDPAAISDAGTQPDATAPDYSTPYSEAGASGAGPGPSYRTPEDVVGPPTQAESEEGEEAGSEARIFEGTVKLAVETEGTVLSLMNFVGELRQNSQFRLLRMVASHDKEGMDIWLGLREPLELMGVLMTFGGVSQVTVPESDADYKEDQNLLRVQLVQ